MKIRTDFVTNSSSSSFVAYRLNNSEFCKYLTEQMKKNDFTYDEYSDERVASYVSINDGSLYADISCPCDGLYCDSYLPEVYSGGIKGYGGSAKEEDIGTMSRNFLDIIAEFVPLEKVDDPEKLYDAFVRDLKNGNFKCDVYVGCTD